MSLLHGVINVNLIYLVQTSYPCSCLETLDTVLKYEPAWGGALHIASKVAIEFMEKFPKTQHAAPSVSMEDFLNFLRGTQTQVTVMHLFHRGATLILAYRGTRSTLFPTWQLLRTPRGMPNSSWHEHGKLQVQPSLKGRPLEPEIPSRTLTKGNRNPIWGYGLNTPFFLTQQGPMSRGTQAPNFIITQVLPLARPRRERRAIPHLPRLKRPRPHRTPSLRLRPTWSTATSTRRNIRRSIGSLFLNPSVRASKIRRRFHVPFARNTSLSWKCRTTSPTSTPGNRSRKQ